MKFNFKNAVLRGTIILTIAGVLSRVIGFFYRIFLTRTIGAAGMGLFQLVMPVIGIAFALCSAGIQTAISKYCASSVNDKSTIDNPCSWLFAGLIISLPLSVAVSILTFTYSDFLASRILLNPQCSTLIKVLAFTFPFSSFHNCVNGLYFGCKKTGVPAFSQLFEQIVRVVTVYIYVGLCSKHNYPVTVICALAGNFIGEIASTLFCLISLFFNKHFHIKSSNLLLKTIKIFKFSIPLTANRLLMHLLQSGETILIPAQLIIYGHSSTEALSIYGILMGMSLPLILFPSALTNSLSVMLLPEVSGAQSSKNDIAIIKTLNRSINFCLNMGILSTLLFLFYGGKIGSIIFNEQSVQWFIMILAWLCPFYYLTTTLGSILNGLGHSTLTCIQNTFGILIRISFLIIFVPKYGISGYLWGLLCSQVLVCLAHYIELYKLFNLPLFPFKHIIYPSLYSMIAIGISLLIYNAVISFHFFSQLICLCIGAFTACIVFALIIYFIYNRKNVKI